MTGPRVIAVTSGKGGVGKTSLVVNLGLTLARKGQRVLLFDADLGLANIEVMLGVTPPYTLYEFLYGDKSMEEVVYSAPGGLQVISGGSGIHELAHLDSTQRQRILELLPFLRARTDFVLVDTGAGISKNVLGFVSAAEEVVLVITPEPTSLTDAYSLIKVLAKFKVHSEARLVVNRARDEQEARQAATKLQVVCNRFLDFNLSYLGTILEDEVVGQGVKEQQPFVLSKPSSSVSRSLNLLADCLIEGKDCSPQAADMFINRLLRLFR
ncbi:MAG: MinD/ParA family protein [Ammonifex sp.]|jgi:flagellar biosynthesis protein FlhG|nr:MAG: MinD/ParA family protein [Ammonifex sp.]